MITQGSKLVVHGRTDVGKVRDHNEDYIDWDVSRGLVILADGMGGHNAGEVASALAVNSIKDALHEILDPEVPVVADIKYDDALEEAIIYANSEITKHALENPACAGMGTTIAVSLFDRDSVIFAHVGDSRIYRIRDKKLEPVTSDHSLVQEMIDNGYLTEEEAMQSASRNLITRALGIAETVDVELSQDKTQNGDIYLLCSDGLTDLVTNKEIMEIMNENQYDLAGATQALIDAANDKGGKDNISVILVGMYEAFSEEIDADD